jgi:uncharacterized protein DUF5343
VADQSKYPYTTVPGKLRDLLQKIPKIGRPEKVTVAWMKSAGWTSSNDPSIIPVLKFVGLVGQDSRPTEIWDAARASGPTGRARVGEAIKAAYSDLFALYPDAHRKDAESLRNFFRSQTSAGEQVQSKLVQTFQTLVEFGDFDSGSSSDGLDAPRGEVPAPRQTSRSGGQTSKSAPSGISLTVNIQLQLPATADAAVYESLFGAMRKHLVELTENE